MNSKTVNEGLAKISLGDGLFYNPRMQFCRDISSLWVGTLPQLPVLVDGFCASGVRGIRYKLENENVGELKFFDRSKTACEMTEKNLKLNKIKGEVNETNSHKFFAQEQNFDFCEIDPFGSPAHFIDSLFWADWKQKQKFISITATDTAVLCGAHAQACYKNYGAKPGHNELCHENGLRILMAFIAKTASKYEWEFEPQFCISHRHYFKILARVKKSAKGAVESAKKSMHYSSFCPSCLFHEISAQFPNELCPQCGKNMTWAGQMWGSKLFEPQTVESMMKNLAQRKYMDSEVLAKYLQRIYEESQAGAFYYNLHTICSKYKVKPAKIDDVVSRLKESGFYACRTTFKDTAIRTDASIEEIVRKMNE
ncbi:MAG: hypothetical protein WC492_01250 [Candidatus Micrarchaeia archaeon]